MKEGPPIAHVASLIGDPARANMLTALLSGKALTATELAHEAGVSQQTASSHLTKLLDGALLQMRKQGRHKYFALANADVASVLESLMGLAASDSAPRTRTGPRDVAMRHARVCYNHLAGKCGVQLFESLRNRDFVGQDAEQITLTDRGRDFMRDFGIDIDALQVQRAPLCRTCLDWSERRTHLSGSLGRAMLARMEELRWIKRDPDSRVILFQGEGAAAFAQTFRI
ncbi:ArsR/SmtB family transcription factor [Yoonia sp. 2307UL14-13]|uniref:ArsR/SmtB family transcription factor n=1 Tax=Yoonia sp. 2307UL14-13 TaxID=3126506 RepID=UPI0030A92E0D